ncbi:MAG: hypothetical protein GX900_04470 [Clostridiaceae bacterium]|nr:hypothetical protein [Clostridiaceae bacterium]
MQIRVGNDRLLIAYSADIAIFVHLPWRAEIRRGCSVDGSRMAENRTPHKKEWMDNIFDPRHIARSIVTLLIELRN